MDSQTNNERMISKGKIYSKKQSYYRVSGYNTPSLSSTQLFKSNSMTMKNISTVSYQSSFFKK